MRSLQPRERLVVWGTVLLLIVLGFYFVIFVPNKSASDRLAVQIDEQQSQLTKLRVAAARKADLERQVGDLQQSLRDIEAKLPSAREIPSLILRLNDLVESVGGHLTLIKPGPTEIPKQTQAGQPAQAAGAPAGGSPARPAGRPSFTAAQLYREFTVEIDVEGQYDSLETFIRGLETFPRFLSISQFHVETIAPKRGDNPRKPKLALSLTTTMYVIPQSEEQQGGNPQ
jgi:Tfp pilus assembly protein PilO